MSGRMKIDEQYDQRLSLPSGDQVCLRRIRPSDKEAMRRAFAELSAHSRHMRFFVAKQVLSDEELRYFTETDGWEHFALGAVSLQEDGREGDGLGIARFFRLTNDPECAEVALTVIDRMQGKGIGRALLERLIEAARERDIRRFRFECLAHNQEMQQLVRRVCRVVETRSDGDLMIVETDLPPRLDMPRLVEQRPLLPLYDLLRAFAIQSVDLQMGLSRAALNQAMATTFHSVERLRRLSPSKPFKRH